MSAKIGLFYGSTTGDTDAIAELIRDEFGSNNVRLHCISEARDRDFAGYNYLIMGSPTWGIGKLQRDWEVFFPELDNIDFRSKKVAYFGLGDQVEYPYNFLDAMGILALTIASRGGIRIGSWSTEGYHFQESKALVSNQLQQPTNGSQILVQDKPIQLVNSTKGSFEDEFVGLGIDEDNQSELTEKRIKVWVAQIKAAIQF
ncbi:MAG: flavodoxin [Methylacidiphilales bacterium]|nr:flavodoxin [Candidatus Methylacidiphilales bacterium]NJR17024.1 flavodoxin [Calothrix sp. CSU_2_0]